MTLKGHYALSFKTRAPYGCYLFIFVFAFNLLVDKWLPTTMTFRKLKQITIKESLGVGRTRYMARFPWDSTILVWQVDQAQLHRNGIDKYTVQLIKCHSLTGWPHIYPYIQYMCIGLTNNNLCSLKHAVAATLLLFFFLRLYASSVWSERR